MDTERVKTGITGLDRILNGGFISQKAYLLRGGPGTGKSNIGYKYLEQGAKYGEETLLITLSETSGSAIENASSMDIDLAGVSVLDLSPEEQIYKEARAYEVFPADTIESQPIIETIVEKVEEVNPKRVVLDSVSMLKYLHQDPFQFRNMVLSFIRYICNGGATVIMISETYNNDDRVSFWVDGIIDVSYAPTWRKINVSKFRGSQFQPGNHALKLSSDGPQVFPKIQPEDYKRKFESEVLSFGIPQMDDLLHGGIEKGTINLITGPTGVGKTSLGLQFLKESSLRGERAVLYTFEESIDTILQRSKGIGIDLKEPIDKGNLQIKPVEPLSYSPEEFADMLVEDIEKHETRTVMLDSIGGYSLSMRDSEPIQRIHALAVYLQNMGVTGLFLNEVPLSGKFISTDIEASYLADNIIYLKYVELIGELHRIIGVLKKRLSNFDPSIRKFEIRSNGIQIGDKIEEFKGFLNGTPNT